jgi:hypothetical protein
METENAGSGSSRSQLNDFQVNRYATFLVTAYENQGRPENATAFAEQVVADKKYEESLRENGFDVPKAILSRAKRLFVEATRKSPGSEREYIAAQAERDGIPLPR